MAITRAVLPVVGFANMVGLPPHVLLRAAGIDPVQLATPDIDLRHSQELRLWSTSARLTADADFGLHFAEWLAPRAEDTFDLLAFALRSCATLGDHYRRAARYVRLVHSGVKLALEEDGDVARLVHGHAREPSSSARHPVEAFLAIAVLAGRLATGVDFTPIEVCFAHPRPNRVSEHERIFRAPVRFGCVRDELLLERELLNRPQRHAEPRLLALLSRQLDGALAVRPDPNRFSEAVRAAMMSELPDREPSMAAVAARLHMSTRTLQRRLQDESVTFAGALTELRRDLAIRYLADERMAIGEVGFLLGFGDATAFHRAFRRWTGTTPSAHRREARERR